MKTSDKEDIVYIEAFKVVKQDLINSLLHKEEDLQLAFGVEVKSKEEEMKYLKHLIAKCNSATRALEEISKNSSNLNELLYSFFIYGMFISTTKYMMEEHRTSIVKGISELEDFLKSLRDRRNPEKG